MSTSTTTTFGDVTDFPESTEMLTTFDDNFGDSSTATESFFTTAPDEISSTTTTTTDGAVVSTSGQTPPQTTVTTVTTVTTTTTTTTTTPTTTTATTTTTTTTPTTTTTTTTTTTSNALPTLFPPGTSFTPVYLINCGAAARFTDGSSREWQQDDFNNGGTVFSIPESELSSATDPGLRPMYAVELNGGRSFVLLEYNLPVPNGVYRLRLHWAELFDGASNPGDRTFHVLVEGVERFRDFDIVSRYGFKQGGYEELDVSVNDGAVTIKLLRVKRSPKINGIEVLQPSEATMTAPESSSTTTTSTAASTVALTTAPVVSSMTPQMTSQADGTTTQKATTVAVDTTAAGSTVFPPSTFFLREVAINAGGVSGDFLSPAHPSLDWDEDEDPAFSADGFPYEINEAEVTLQPLSVYSLDHGTAAQQATSLRFMYASERTAGFADAVSYAIPLPGGSGPRRVRLHFAELLDTSAAVGDRLMNIAVEGSRVATNFDTVAAFGFRTGGFLELDVDVADGVLNVDISRVKKVRRRQGRGCYKRLLFAASFSLLFC